MEMTELMSCEDVSLRRWDMMHDPSGVGSSDGSALVCPAVVVLVDVRYEMAMVMPPVSACRR